MSDHSVEQHLQVSADEYDKMIRTFVPHYEELLDATVGLLKTLIAPSARIMDLGGGTGALTQSIARGCPESHIELLDIDPQMLGEARKRLAKEGSRITIRQGSFFDPLPTSDAIVASLSLHHIHDLEQKTTTYQSILRALKPGGVFLNLDAAVSADPRLNQLAFDRWAEFMGNHGITAQSAFQHFSDWAREDRYFSLHEEFSALSKAGFKNPECFWRRGPMAIYGGLKE